MDNIYYTLQEYLLHTESVTYLIIVISLLFITGFWFFLTGRDDD